MEERKKSKFTSILERVIFTAAGAAAELYAISILLGERVSVKFVFLFLFLIVPIYGLDFLREYKSQMRSIQRYILNFIVALALLAFILLLFSIGNLWISLISILLMLVGFFYDPYFKSLTKKIIGFKDYFVIFCFNAFVLSYLLWIKPGLATTIVVLIFAITRDFVNITYCDIKDISSDKQKGLLTFAATLGINKLLMINFFINLASILIIFLGVRIGALGLLGYSLIIPVIVTSFLIYVSHQKRSYSPMFVDFEYFIWLAAILLGSLSL